MNALKALLLDRYRCPAEEVPDFDIPENFFDAAGGPTSGVRRVSPRLNPGEFVDNLRYERYFDAGERWLEKPGARNIYYGLRRFMPDSFRRHLQRIYLTGWDSLAFPAWPVDRTADIVLERILALAIKASGKNRVPFVWFWPQSHKACAIVTHDIETQEGRDFTHRLLDIDTRFGIKSSVQVVPEERYEVPREFLDEIRRRGCEVNVHGLNHDGNLFQDRAMFLERAREINEYAVLFGAKGFRSPVMYRNVDWFRELNFSYDMSVPNVARLEPQQGGCCTVLPYSLPGGMTELPLTTVQDYALFHMLNDYSITLWKQQMSLILKGHGLMSFIVHPDYVLSKREQDVYKQLLAEIERFGAEREVWLSTPGEVDLWWREREKMRMVPSGSEWTIEGPGSERATIAYASVEGENLVFEFPSETPCSVGSAAVMKEGAR